MRVLVVGSGAREHALAWKIAQSASLTELHAAPGNPGIARIGACHPVRADDGDGLVSLCTSLDIDLAVIGPEQPLVAGAADALRHGGFAVFGPSADAARVEGSKRFAKDVMEAAGVPTARTLPVARVPCVVKADGLAAGKGVFVCRTDAELDEGLRAANALGGGVLVEELLEGDEVSVFALTDGRTVVPLGAAQDFKRIGDGDSGPNTGGMGAYSPVPFVTDDVVEDVMEAAVRPTLHHLRGLGIEYRGVLYAGLMLTPDGPKVLEYNVRFGDPEAQVVLPRLVNDLGELCLAAATGSSPVEPKFADDACVTVVLATEGYPGSPRPGDAIHGIDAAEEVDGVAVFQAGTAARDGDLVTAGGRVLAVTAVAPTLADARARAYEAAARIRWPGVQYRRDIAALAVDSEQGAN